MENFEQGKIRFKKLNEVNEIIFLSFIYFFLKKNQKARKEMNNFTKQYFQCVNIAFTYQKRV